MLTITLQRPNASLSALMMCILVFNGVTSAEEPARAFNSHSIQQQLNKIRSDESSERRRMEKDEQLIEQLEQQLQQLQSRDIKLSKQADALEVANDKLKANTAVLQDSQKQLAAGFSEQFGSAMSRYLGSHQFTWNGAVAGDFIYDRGNNTNTFALTFQPLVIYRLNDWISFVGELEAALPQGSEAKFGLPIAMFQDRKSTRLNSS